jgi:outer membrane protein OmpA-like peptidoglycan-associated protein
MNRFFLFLLLIFFGTSPLANAQFDRESHAKGIKLFDEGEFRAAIDPLKEAVESDPEAVSNKAIEANFLLGICYLKVGEGEIALPYMKKVYEIDKEYYPELEYMMGQCAESAQKFKEAIRYYQNFLKVEGVKKDPVILAEVNKRLDECKVASELMTNPLNVKIENIGTEVNSPYPDYTPVLTADESMMIFTSRRIGNLGKKTAPYLDQEEEFPLEDIYVTYKKDGKWTAPENLGSPVNTDDHDAAIALSPDGSQLFIYKGNGEGDIYISRKKGLVWTKPVSISEKINLPTSSELSCSITSDGKTLYFSSSRPGGYGGLDIWKSQLINGQWSEPMNMGPKINTREDEDAPFIHPDGVTLYFSTKGKNTMGGYDIVYTTLEKNGWIEPENMGFPINSVNDDIYYVVTANDHGYFSTYKSGGSGKHDIFMISRGERDNVGELASTKAKTKVSKEDDGKTDAKPSTVAVNTTKSKVTLLKGIITDAATGSPMEATLSIVNVKTGSKISDITSNSATGAYLVIMPAGKNYAITVTAPDYLFHSENFDIPDTAEYTEVVRPIAMKKASIGTRIVMRNIFFDFDKATLRPESNLELDRLRKVMLDYPKMKIEISGHTDNKGSADYNKKLSESRAKSVLDYLVKKGISPDRMTSVGYGFDRSLAPNENEEGRQLNRRTEFEIKGF